MCYIGIIMKENVNYEQAQQQIFSRSDIATTKRAFQDIKNQASKLSKDITHYVSNTSNCSEHNFQEAWNKRQELNKLKEQLSAMEEQMTKCMPSQSNSRLKDHEKTEIKGLYQSGLYTQQQLATQYGVTQPTIHDIVN